ncbi:MAG: UDP-N-acetylmuramoyl-L-alanyl-D-glutamate--2,6-diaminopimelate ligase [Clostridia bacterium]|nr:UDP-N-acetylmuramoyl-L-alanyl-D-glutamate--2,6-diaminopimelate ligase [Clostridia bacterium]
MKLSHILSEIEIVSTNIPCFDFCFNKICSDTSELELGDIFVCKRGSNTDGHEYIKKAYELGARCFVVERVTDELKNNSRLRYIRVKNTPLAEVKLLNAAFNYPARNMRLVAITGTNGKTSVAYMLKHILDCAGICTGLIGTVKSFAGKTDITRKKSSSDFNSMTTPPPSELFSLLTEMREHGCDTIVLEASSHALKQKRLDALQFALGVFTNLSEDHLDYHKSLSDYINAKSHLFELSDCALINTDDPVGADIAKKLSCNVITYGKSKACDHTAIQPVLNDSGIEFDARLKGQAHVSCPIPGEFTVYNALCAAAAASYLGVSDRIIVQALESMPQIPGRLERIRTPNDINIFIDYAHTPDALEKAITTLKSGTRGRMITVFGCGGNREREKRPIMGRIATYLSDLTVITSDNSRNESTDRILNDIVSGIGHNTNYKVLPDRTDAINFALCIARPGDTVLLAGKGHEDYLLCGNEKKHFSEKETVENFYKRILKTKELKGNEQNRA